MGTAIRVNKEWLEFAFWTAGANWLTWHADFEFAGDVAHLPVLQHHDRYRHFIKSYGLLRGKTYVQRCLLRRKLYKSKAFRIAVIDETGIGIEKLACLLRKQNLVSSVERSFLSKLAAFAKPASFVAWDRFARRGVSTLTGGPKNGDYQTYADYLRGVNRLLNDPLGEDIQCFLKNRKLPTDNRDAFVRRVIDVYLMVQGGRWSTELRQLNHRG
jgi:hypothetical protein